MSDGDDFDRNPIWDRWDAAAGGGDQPPDSDPRGPARDPAPTCPIIPLGMHDGVFHFLDRRREYRVLNARQLGNKAELLALLGGNDTWCWECFPRMVTRKIDGTPTPIITGWSLVAVVAWLMRACADAPMFGPQITVRRPGVWPGEHGEPVAHCGDGLLIDGTWHRRRPAYRQHHLAGGSRDAATRRGV